MSKSRSLFVTSVAGIIVIALIAAVSGAIYEAFLAHHAPTASGAGAALHSDELLAMMLGMMANLTVALAAPIYWVEARRRGVHNLFMPSGAGGLPLNLLRVTVLLNLAVMIGAALSQWVFDMRGFDVLHPLGMNLHLLMAAHSLVTLPVLLLRRFGKAEATA